MSAVDANEGTTDDPRAELATIAASLRAYLEWQLESGASGAPRGERRNTTAAPAVAAVTEARTTLAPAATPVAVASEAPIPVAIPAASPAVPARAPAPADATAIRAPSAEAAPTALAPIARAVLAPPATGSAPRSLLVLEQAAAGCTACRLAETRTRTVFARGNPEASLVFLGEAPGADEDAQGVPFVGRAGQLLDKMIVAMGLSPERDVYVCNIVKCRPPQNRRPEADELAACAPFLDEQLANVSPKVIVALGNTAVGALFNTKMGITRLRGEWKLYKGRIPTMPTYHPSYLLRQSPDQLDARRQVWEDLQLVMKELGLSPRPRF